MEFSYFEGESPHWIYVSCSNRNHVGRFWKYWRPDPSIWVSFYLGILQYGNFSIRGFLNLGILQSGDPSISFNLQKQLVKKCHSGTGSGFVCTSLYMYLYSRVNLTHTDWRLTSVWGPCHFLVVMIWQVNRGHSRLNITSDKAMLGIISCRLIWASWNNEFYFKTSIIVFF